MTKNVDMTARLSGHTGHDEAGLPLLCADSETERKESEHPFASALAACTASVILSPPAQQALARAPAADAQISHPQLYAEVAPEALLALADTACAAPRADASSALATGAPALAAEETAWLVPAATRDTACDTEEARAAGLMPTFAWDEAPELGTASEPASPAAHLALRGAHGGAAPRCFWAPALLADSVQDGMTERRAGADADPALRGQDPSAARFAAMRATPETSLAGLPDVGESSDPQVHRLGRAEPLHAPHLVAGYLDGPEAGPRSLASADSATALYEASLNRAARALREVGLFEVRAARFQGDRAEIAVGFGEDSVHLSVQARATSVRVVATVPLAETALHLRESLHQLGQALARHGLSLEGFVVDSPVASGMPAGDGDARSGHHLEDWVLPDVEASRPGDAHPKRSAEPQHAIGVRAIA